MKSIDTWLRQLTFDDLSQWTGEAILSRGKGYMSRVNQLSLTRDNTLAAWVIGGDRYATSVRLDEGGHFHCFCTCPYSWGPCKHAVAVILAAADQVKQQRTFPPLDEDSDLALTLFDDADEEWVEDELDEVSENSLPDKCSGSSKEAATLEALLENKSRDELLGLLISLGQRFPVIRQHILETRPLVDGQIKKVARHLKAEIIKLTEEAAWYNHWNGEGSLPDYSRLEEKFYTLANQGFADELLELGEELWRRRRGFRRSKCMAPARPGSRAARNRKSFRFSIVSRSGNPDRYRHRGKPAE